MSEKRNRSSILPLWFRVLLGASFAVLLLGFLLARDGGARAAIARAMFERLAAPTSPVLQAQALLGESRTEPGRGAYYLNGMLVRYDSFGTPLGAGPTLIQIETQMDRAGYVHRILPIHGTPTVVGIHPDSLVMITARPGRDLKGRPALRLSQQDLTQLDPSFEAEIPGVAIYPGAANRVLVQSAEGPPSTSLIYAAGGVPDDVRAYYLEEMHQLGWSSLEAPTEAAGDLVRVLFFARGDKECSVVLVTTPEAAGTYVMATQSGRLEEAS